MKSLSFTFKSFMSYMVSSSLIMGPLLSTVALSPSVSQAQQASPDQSDYQKANDLSSHLVSLIERATLARIPRRGPQGPPTAQEISDVAVKLKDIRSSLQASFKVRVFQAEDPQAEIDILEDINLYFDAARKFEGLKIILGQESDPKSWSTNYDLSLPLNPLSQLKFLETASFFSNSFVALPVEAYDKDVVEKTGAEAAPFRVRLEAPQNQWNIVFHLSSNFAGDFERIALLSRPSIKSGLEYTALFSAHRLYESLSLTRLLMGKSVKDLPPPNESLQSNWLSLRLAQNSQKLEYQRQLFTLQKPQIYRAIMTAIDQANKKNLGWALDADFFQGYAKLLGFDPSKDANTNLEVSRLETIKQEERKNFEVALSSLLNLTDISEWSGLTPFLILEAKRLSLRWSFLANADLSSQISEEAQPKVEEFINQRAKGFADQLISNTNVAQAVAALLPAPNATVIHQMQIAFHKRLKASAIKLKNFTQEKININYLAQSQATQIEALNSSPLVAAVLKAVVQQPTYELAYAKFKEMLLTYVQGFTFPQPLPHKLTLVKLGELAPQAHFDYNLVSKSVAPKYQAALNPKSQTWWEWVTRSKSPTGPGPREKDLNDLLAVGNLLKFDIYELLNGAPATLDNMGFDSGWVSKYTHSETKSYLEEMKKDILSAAPLLASEENGVPLYKTLADSQLSDAAEKDLILRQLGRVEDQIHKDELSLATGAVKVNAIQNDDFSQIGIEMRDLATRTTQVAVELASYSSFSGYNGILRQQLLLPSFWHQEWDEFSQASSSALNVMFAVMFMQFVGGRVGALAKVTESFGKMMAPIFGPNFSKLNTLFLATIGISLSDQLYRGFVSEPAHAAVLQDYFACGSGAPCVALYSDVKDQADKVSAPRMQALTTVVGAIVIIGGLRFIGKAVGVLRAAPAVKAIKGLQEDLIALGLKETSTLDPKTLTEALQTAMSEARQAPSPLIGAVAEASAQQAYFRIESRILKEASMWRQYSEAFTGDLQKLGLTERSWMDMESVSEALTRLESRYKSGQLLTTEYKELKYTLTSIYKKLSPTWKQMQKNPSVANFYKRVWDQSSRATLPELTGSRRYYDQRISLQFQKALDDYYFIEKPQLSNGQIIWPTPQPNMTSNSRMDSLIQKIVFELIHSPEVSSKRLLELQVFLKRGAAK